MPIIELNFPAYTVMPRIVCSEVPKKKFKVLNMRRLKFDDGPHLPRHFRSSLTRVTEDPLPLVKPTIQILIFRPVIFRVYVEAAVADAAAKRKRATRAVDGGSGGSAGRKESKQGGKEAKRRQ